jgi:hypothetical protein
MLTRQCDLEGRSREMKQALDRAIWVLEDSIKEADGRSLRLSR